HGYASRIAELGESESTAGRQVNAPLGAGLLGRRHQKRMPPRVCCPHRAPILANMRRGVVGAMVLTVGIGCSATVSDEPSAGADHGEDHLVPAIEATDPDAPPVRHRQLRVSLRPPDGDPGGPGPDRRTVTFRVYDPVDQVSRTRGLMGVTDLPDDAGMLFRFATPRTGGFWMKN